MNLVDGVAEDFDRYIVLYLHAKINILFPSLKYDSGVAIDHQEVSR